MGSSVKLVFRTLARKEYSLDVGLEERMGWVKAMLCEEHSLAVERLVYSGKVLDDSCTVVEARVCPGSSILAIVKPSPRVSRPARVPAVPVEESTPPPPAPGPVSDIADISELELNEEEVVEVDDESVSRLVSFGFTHDMVLEALAVSGGDESVAANYLFEHIYFHSRGMSGDKETLFDRDKEKTFSFDAEDILAYNTKMSLHKLVDFPSHALVIRNTHEIYYGPDRGSRRVSLEEQPVGITPQLDIQIDPPSIPETPTHLST